MDGSQKLPQRLLAPIAARLERGQGIETLALAVAAWMRWQSGRTDAGEAFAVDDPLAAETARRLAGLRDPADQVRALLGIEAIFPPALAADPRFAEAVTRQLAPAGRAGRSGSDRPRLVRRGARRADPGLRADALVEIARLGPPPRAGSGRAARRSRS